MPTGKRTPQTEAWRNMCIQRIASTGALAISSVISSGCSWACTTGSTRRKGRRRRRPRPRPVCQLIGEEGRSRSIMVTAGARLLGKLSRVLSDDCPTRIARLRAAFPALYYSARWHKVLPLPSQALTWCILHLLGRRLRIIICDTMHSTIFRACTVISRFRSLVPKCVVCPTGLRRRMSQTRRMSHLL